MEDNDILDSEFNEDINAEILEGVEWWEKKRLVYNFILLGVEIFVMLFNISALMFFGTVEGIIYSILYNIVANILFTGGWVLEILQIYYYKTKMFRNERRFILFVMGVIFSVYLTYNWYSSVLMF